MSHNKSPIQFRKTSPMETLQIADRGSKGARASCPLLHRSWDILSQSVLGASCSKSKAAHEPASSSNPPHFDVQCWMFNVGCSMFDVQCSMFNVRCSMFLLPLSQISQSPIIQCLFSPTTLLIPSCHPLFFDYCLHMNQAMLLRQSRSKHTLKSSEAAAKQLRAFRAVLPISTRNSESSELTSMKRGSISKSRRPN